MGVPAGVDQPPFQPLDNELQIAGSGCQEVAVLGKPGDRAVVEDNSGLVADHRVTDPTDLEVPEAVRVDPVEQLAGVFPLDFDLPQRADIDDTNTLAHRVVFLLETLLLAQSGVSVIVERTFPFPHIHPHGVQRLVLVVQRAPPDR